jgi:ABC-2 type transport system ATP-binding protein
VIQVGFHEVDEALLAQISELPAIDQASLLPQEASPLAEEAEEVDDVEGAPDEDLQIVKVECANSQQALVELIDLTNQRDLKITSLNVLEPNLESVFLHLTGKKLRE